MGDLACGRQVCAEETKLSHGMTVVLSWSYVQIKQTFKLKCFAKTNTTCIKGHVRSIDRPVTFVRLESDCSVETDGKFNL